MVRGGEWNLDFGVRKEKVEENGQNGMPKWIWDRIARYYLGRRVFRSSILHLVQKPSSNRQATATKWDESSKFSKGSHQRPLSSFPRVNLRTSPRTENPATQPPPSCQHPLPQQHHHPLCKALRPPNHGILSPHRQAPSIISENPSVLLPSAGMGRSQRRGIEGPAFWPTLEHPSVT